MPYKDPKRQREWTLKNRERLLAYRRAYYRAHRQHIRAAAKKWAREHVEKRSATAKAWYRKHYRIHRDRVYRWKFGISVDQYEAQLKQQHGRCAICRSKNPGTGKHFHVDHCHKTKRFRGLLCTRCNTGLGQFRDSPKLLRRAIAHLQK